MPVPADGYAGDVTPAEAFDMVKAGTATMVDVRTHAEWVYVGVPDLSSTGAQLVSIEWVSYPTGRPNPQFLAQLAAATGGPGDRPIVLLCRSAVRSVAAAKAATAAGYTHCYSILHGFEGGLDDAGHRGATGWRAEGLPWRQG